MLISPLQKYEPKEWSGLTTENHLGALYQTEPILVSNMIEQIYAVNYGSDLVNYLQNIPVMYIDEDVPFEWLLQGADEKNIPLVDYYNEDMSTKPARPGINGTRFVMIFAERMFEYPEVIVGEKPDLYKVRITADPTVYGGGGYAYVVELVTNSRTFFVPPEELASGTRWSKEYALTSQTLSKKGGGVSHTSPFRMSNFCSMIRKQYTVPGNMINKGKNRPLAFSWKDENGNTQTRWINKLDWDFNVQFRREKARLIVYGNSNKLSDGTFYNYGDSGFEIRAGAGIQEQVAPSNIFYYSTFSADWLTEVAIGLSFGKLPEDQRQFVLSTGEYGMYQFHKEISNKATTFTPNFTQDRIKMTGDGKMTYRGQFLEYQAVNGIVFRVVHDPMKDDPVRNKLYHPEGGLAKSREYDLMDFGTANGEPNVQRVAIRDEEEVFAYIPGIRDPFSPNGAGKPKLSASSIDGYEVHRAFWGGARIKNPMRMARIIPNILA